MTIQLNESDSGNPGPLLPAFLVGAHRSGTTLLRLMLDHHPEISVPGEFDFLTEIMTDREARPAVSEYLQQLSLHRGFVARALDCDLQDSYESLVKSFVMQLWTRHPGKVFIAVVHTGFQELARIWPESKFIHIMRDPRDVAASAVKLGWAGNVYSGVNRWITAETAWDELSKTVPAVNRCEIHFERMISDLPKTLQQLCSFLNVSYSEEMLNYHLNTTYGPPDPALTNQWQRKLSPTQVGLVEGVLGDLLEKSGYQRSGHPAIHPSGWERKRLLLHDRVARLRFRLERFGVWNTLGIALARRLRLRSIEQRFQSRMNTIAVKHLK